jgi:replicative superfamily II helicase
MAELNIKELVRKMLEASKEPLRENFEEAKDFAEQSYKTVLENAELLARKTVNGDITEEQAKILLRMQIRAAESVLLAIEGIGILAAQRAVNAAINVIKDAVNAILPVQLL